MIELYEFALSGNAHKVRLMLSLLRLEYQSIPGRSTGSVAAAERSTTTPAEA
jgi:glutathione S-transferase